MLVGSREAHTRGSFDTGRVFMAAPVIINAFFFASHLLPNYNKRTQVAHPICQTDEVGNQKATEVLAHISSEAHHIVE